MSNCSSCGALQPPVITLQSFCEADAALCFTNAVRQQVWVGFCLYVARLYAMCIIHHDIILLVAGSETPNYTSPVPNSLGGRSSQRPSPAEGQGSSAPSSALKGSKVCRCCVKNLLSSRCVHANERRSLRGAHSDLGGFCHVSSALQATYAGQCCHRGGKISSGFQAHAMPWW